VRLQLAIALQEIRRISLASKSRPTVGDPRQNCSNRRLEERRDSSWTKCLGRVPPDFSHSRLNRHFASDRAKLASESLRPDVEREVRGAECAEYLA
jgi:hypothetical protein